MKTSIRHLALFVPELQKAEQYYQTIFEMELVGREAMLDDGLWHSLPFDKGWEDAQKVGIELGMCSLRKGSFVLALFRGHSGGGQVYVIGLEMPAEQIAGVRERLPQDTFTMEEGPDSLTFLDPYQITWQISQPGGEFRTAGDYANRWLEI
jgi:catechol 2,3-dioxygenase-like lactoylglutathione lyase family enzyme